MIRLLATEPNMARTYQSYIRPHWGIYNILTIISDQFWAIAYQWDEILPAEKRAYFEANWMKTNILENHGELCSIYKAHDTGSHGLSGDTDFDDGDFRSEGDSPSFLHSIPTGLRNMESPDYGGWGGRYVKIRENTWLDPVRASGFEYPEGRWYSKTAWGRNYMRNKYPEHPDLMKAYFNPIVRWTDAIQNDFAARADWCVKPYNDANHPPVVRISHDLDLNARPGLKIRLSAQGTYDPDKNQLNYKWWLHKEASSFKGNIDIENSNTQNALLTVPANIDKEERIHIICEVNDNGTPQLTRYKRIIINVLP